MNSWFLCFFDGNSWCWNSPWFSDVLGPHFLNPSLWLIMPLKVCLKFGDSIKFSPYEQMAQNKTQFHHAKWVVVPKPGRRFGWSGLKLGWVNQKKKTGGSWGNVAVGNFIQWMDLFVPILKQCDIIWLVVWTPLKNISQLGWWNSQYMGKYKMATKPPTSHDTSLVSTCSETRFNACKPMPFSPPFLQVVYKLTIPRKMAGKHGIVLPTSLWITINHHHYWSPWKSPHQSSLVSPKIWLKQSETKPFLMALKAPF